MKQCMRTAVFSSQPYDRRFLERANRTHHHDLVFFEARLDASTAKLAVGFEAVCVFVNDTLDAAALAQLKTVGVRLVTLRCTGFNNVDLRAAERLGIAVARVPSYSPESVAEFTIGLLLSLQRQIHRAWARVREDNFALEGLLGRLINGRRVGVVGTGRIGELVARILHAGFGCDVLACDPIEKPKLKAMGIRYETCEHLLSQCEIVTLHCPLTPQTHHLIDSVALARARPGLVIVNTSRGALIDTAALIDGLKSSQVGGVALDVYEQEGDLFFQDLSNEIVRDDLFQRLLTFPNVLVTGHQAFFTDTALDAIAEVTLDSLTAFERGEALPNRLDTSHLAD
jgi:D-lactate dehydrogenase